MDPKETFRGAVDWIYLAQDTDHDGLLVRTVMNVWFNQMPGICVSVW
jgi:hypothetical protein